MRRALLAALTAVLLVPLAQVMPVPLSAGLFCHHGFNPCGLCDPCGVCRVNPCSCPAPVPQVSYHAPVPAPVVSTPVVTSTPVVSYRDVTETRYRLQAETQTVPVTMQQTVTVDEGRWHKVWVPKLVQKTVPVTRYQQQTVYRQVPHQVTRRVPQASWHTSTAVSTHTAHTAAVAAGTSTCAGSSLSRSPVPPAGSASGLPTLGHPVAIPSSRGNGAATLPMSPSNQPVQLRRELQPLDPVAPPAPSSTGPVPDPQEFDGPQAANPGEDSDWTPVLAADPADEEVSSPGSSSGGRPDRAGSASGFFVPAPSAANVWRSRFR